MKESQDAEIINRLSKELNIDSALSNLLAQRGVRTFDEAKCWFRPSLDSLHDPFLMMDMGKAVDRLNESVSKNEPILIFGDYDVDGTTAVSLCWSFLKGVGANVGYYIPDRYKEGYGISYQGIDYAKDNGYKLIIALDCGIKSVDHVRYANEKNIDFIICDHHHPGDVLPDAIAVLNAKRHDCQYPYKELSGCGVGFKLMQAYCISNKMSTDKVFAYLDVLAVSIISDIVDMTGENRILAYHGMKKLISDPSIGLKAIKEICGLDKGDVTMTDIGFKIGPRINAAGRIASGNMSVELLISTDKDKAMSIVNEMNDCNTERKDIDHKITSDALDMISEGYCYENSTVVFNPNWHKGVVGIVASRLIETRYRPTIVLTESNGKVSGSARSIDGFDLYSALEKCSHLMDNFGGHMYAAGMTLKDGKLDEFRETFESVVASSTTPDMFVRKIRVDAKIKLDTITDKFYNVLNQFEPFGPGNPEPVFVTEGVVDAGGSKIVGKDGKHLKLSVRSTGSDKTMDAIAFSMGESWDGFKDGEFDVCYTVGKNTFRGNTKIQLMVKDMKINI